MSKILNPEKYKQQESTWTVGGVKYTDKYLAHQAAVLLAMERKLKRLPNYNASGEDAFKFRTAQNLQNFLFANREIILEYLTEHPCIYIQ